MAGNTRQAQVDVMAFTRQMEEVAYDTYREWPIFLVRRQQQLETILVQSGAAVKSDFAPVVQETPDVPQTGCRSIFSE